MKKLILIFLFPLFISPVFGQSRDSTFYIGLNIAPYFLTQINFFVEKPIDFNLVLFSGFGYVINGPSSIMKLGTEKELEKSSGAFINIGLTGHLSNTKRISPMAGIRVINSYSYELWYDSAVSLPPHKSTGYNLGLGGVVGITGKLTKRLSFDLGFQLSYLLINNLCDFHSFTPGMGRNWSPARWELITQIKYKL